MRPVERIDNFLKLVDWLKVSERWSITPLDLYKALDVNNYLEYWKENPDQRIGQVLINLELIPDSFKIWNDEESDILIDQGVAPEDCLYWTSIFNKDNQKLLQPITKLISDLETDHINAILVDPRLRLDALYIKAFNNVLENRAIIASTEKSAYAG